MGDGTPLFHPPWALNDEASIMTSVNLEIRLKNKAVCTVEVDARSMRVERVLDVADARLLPPMFHNSSGVDPAMLTSWWRRRLTRRLLEVLKEDDGTIGATVLGKGHAVSLSDCYWTRELGDDVSWAEVGRFHGGFDALRFEELASRLREGGAAAASAASSPTLTVGGNLPKWWAWSEGDGVCELWKGSSPGAFEALKEAAVYPVARALVPEGAAVLYRVERTPDGEAWSVCPCFVSDKFDFVPAIDCVVEPAGGMEGYDALARVARKDGIEDFDERAARMVVFDALVGNVDRHWGNFGFMRDVRTGRLVGVAPLFDNGACLGVPSGAPYGRGGAFASSPALDLEVVRDLSWLEASMLDEALEALEEGLEQIVATECGELTPEWAEELLEECGWRADMILAERDARL